MVIVIKSSNKRMFDKGQEFDGVTNYDPENPGEIEITIHSSVFKDPRKLFEVLGHELDHASLFLIAERFNSKPLTHVGKHHRILRLLDDIRSGAMDDLLK